MYLIKRLHRWEYSDNYLLQINIDAIIHLKNRIAFVFISLSWDIDRIDNRIKTQIIIVVTVITANIMSLIIYADVYLLQCNAILWNYFHERFITLISSKNGKCVKLNRIFWIKTRFAKDNFFILIETFYLTFSNIKFILFINVL